MVEIVPAKRRRLAAVLSADVVGYVRLMRINEEGTHQRFMTCRAQILEPLIATHGGRVVKKTGDGVLAEFPSAINAVRFALASQRELAALMAAVPVDERLAFRMGIAVGDVLVEADDIYGDTVNLAVRLQGEAEAGGVCGSRTVYEQTCEGLASIARFETIGSRALKHVTDPIPAWRVQPAGSVRPGRS
jgi:class 3 adenylate cyclase